MKFKSRRTYFSRLESVAMTDIVFLLLIFFLLSSSFVPQTGIKVDLPGARKTSVNEVKHNLSIAINEEGKIYLNENLTDKDLLQAELKKMLENSSDKVVIFRPDKNIKVEKLVEIMDIASAAGAERLVIATKIKE
ncbi:MAG: biopolymer transporter ExbD [Candidatus Margulisbacteria bacterium]|nr:biopolymer transporter ExbD [Candidatus Margulisiibacteriota bacterium]